MTLTTTRAWPRRVVVCAVVTALQLAFALLFAFGEIVRPDWAIDVAQSALLVAAGLLGLASLGLSISIVSKGKAGLVAGLVSLALLLAQVTVLVVLFIIGHS